MARRTALNRSRLISELNMTPLIDLTFLLLITFMITIPLVEQASASACEGQGQRARHVPHVLHRPQRQGRAVLRQPAHHPGTAGERPESKAEADPDVTILVRADETIPYGKVVAVLRLMHEANVTRMALVTDPR